MQLSLRNVRLMAPAVRLPRTAVIAALGVVLFLAIGAFAPNVLTPENVRNVLIQASYLALFAAAQSIVILTRGLDLSLGNTVSLVSVVAALAMTALHVAPAAAAVMGIAAGLGVGAFVGCCNGAGVARFGVNPFIMTLGTLNVLLSIATTVSGGYPVQGLPDAFTWLANVSVLGLPLQLVISVAILAALQWMLRKSVFGKSLYMIGSNPKAARLAGIPVQRHLFTAYIICSAIAAVGALLLTARTGSGEPNLGGDLTLSAIAAAVLGGTRLRGGEGSIAAPVIGALLVTIISNGLNLLQVNGFIQQVILGFAILAALGFDRRGRA